jgi:hypothetical protein
MLIAQYTKFDCSRVTFFIPDSFKDTLCNTMMFMKRLYDATVQYHQQNQLRTKPTSLRSVNVVKLNQPTDVNLSHGTAAAKFY